LVIGHDLDEDVPDHSSLIKIRERYGKHNFQQFFEPIVELRVEAGLVLGAELDFDSTKVGANAVINSMIDRTESEANQNIEYFGRILKGKSLIYPSRFC